MKISNTNIILFSPTGGTKACALQLMEGICPGGAANLIDITEPDCRTAASIPDRFSRDALVLFALPVYGGRIPGIAAEQLRRFRGDKTPAILLTVYGNRACEDALLELSDLVRQSGFLPAAGVEAVAQHSLLPRFGQGRPDEADCNELLQFGEQLAVRLMHIKSAEFLRIPRFPGERPFRAYNGVSLHPKANRRCTACGLCAKACPAGAIPLGAPNKTDAGICISCMHCAAICPQKARRLDPLLKLIASHKMKKACAGRKENVLF